MTVQELSQKDITRIKETYKKKSLWISVLKRYLKSSLAIIGTIIVISMILIALLADIIAPFDYKEQHLTDSLKGPSGTYWFGTDQFGRDILSRIIYGARTSLVVSFFAVLISATIGCILGAVSGYFSGFIDNVIMRGVDILLAIPNMLLAISISAMLGPGLINTVIALSIGDIGAFARIMRASVLTIRDQEFIEAVRAVSASDFRIIMKHIIPNIMAPIIVQFTLRIAQAMIGASSLSFIGLGVQPPTPEWGAMLADGRSFMRDCWWLTVFPGLAITITVYGFNLMGDGLRDAMDPRLKD